MAQRPKGTTPPPSSNTTVSVGDWKPPTPSTTVPSTPVVPTTTVPPVPSTTVPIGDWTPPSTTTVPGAAAPGPVSPISAVPTNMQDVELIRARAALARAQRSALGAGVSPGQVESIVERKEPNWGLKVLGKVINFDIIPGGWEFKPVDKFVIKPLQVFDTPRRAIVGAYGEAGQAIRNTEAFQYILEKVPYSKQLIFMSSPLGASILLSKPRVYESQDQIPIDETTGLPKYKIGDVREEEKARWSDIADMITSPEKGFGDYVNTGNKWADRAAGFTGDVLLDPITYLTFGAGGVAKQAGKEAIEAGVTATSKQVMKDVAKEAGEKAVQLADDSARLQGQFLTKAERQLIFRTEEAASMAAQQAAQAALTPAQQAVQQQLRRQAAIGPRRVLGARSREELAQIARELREYAIQVGNQRVVNALSDEVISDIATRGYAAIRGSVAEALGVRGGIRFGVGTAKVILPGTERIADTFGSLFSAIRVGKASPIRATFNNAWLRTAVDTVNKGFVNTRVGKGLLRATLPVGEGGLFGSEDIVRMRQALRTGTYQGARLTPTEGADFVRLLAEDNAYRALKASMVAEANQLVAPLYRNPEFFRNSNTIHELVENPAIDLTTATAADASRVLGRQVTDAELTAAKQFKEIGDEFYNRANYIYQRAQLAAGTQPNRLIQLPKNANWFPHTMSDKARRFLNANRNISRQMEDALEQLGVDRSFALAGSNLRQLKPGSNWFGYRLTPADIAGGVRRLNELARQYGRLKFDFFETNAERALSKYAQGWARDVSFSNFLYNMTIATEMFRRNSPIALDLGDSWIGAAVRGFGGGQFAGKGFAGELTQESAKLVTGVKMPTQLRALENAVNSVITPERVARLDAMPALRQQADNIVQEMRGLSQEIQTKAARGELVFADTVNQTLNDLEQRIVDLERLVTTADIPAGYGATLSAEADALLQSFRNEMNNIVLDINSLDPQKWAQTVPFFIDAANQFLQLNSIKYPGIISSPQFQELITNFRRLEDPLVARGMNRALGAINRMFKGWVTSTPGFHVRNALSNVFFMAVAGANPNNLVEGARVFNAYRKFIKRVGRDFQPRQPVSVLAMEEYITELELYNSRLVADFLASPEARKAGIDELVDKYGTSVLDIFVNTPATGFGQVSDVFEGTGRLGITGGVQTRTGVLPSVSRGLGKPLSWSRGVGNDIENWTRFALLWDGMRQGLSPEESAARVRKYLIDYSDLSQADQIARTIIPFWMWASRSMPLILESMWANPRAFQIWNSFTRNLEDKETGEMFLPSYLRAAVPVGGNFIFNPDFGYQRQEEAFGNLLDPRGLLSSVTPVLRAPFIEAPLNQRLQTGERLYDERYQDPLQAQTAYVLQQLFPQAGFVGKLANVGIAGALAAGQIPGAPQGALESIAAAPQTQVPEWAREFLGIGKPAFIQEEQGVMTPEEARQRAFSFFGLPFLELQPWQQQQVIEDIIKQLEAAESRKRAQGR
jgi:hypothetical protein